MAIDDGYDRLNYRCFLPEYCEYRHIAKYMVRVGLSMSMLLCRQSETKSSVYHGCT